MTLLSELGTLGLGKLAFSAVFLVCGVAASSQDQATGLMLDQSASVISDPLSGTDNPHAIPGALIEFTIRLTIPATGVDSVSGLRFENPVPATMVLCTDNWAGPDMGPVVWTDGPVKSGLSLNFISLVNTGDSIAFSNDGGASWDYQPQLNRPCDPDITNLRIVPVGTIDSSGTPTSFSVQYRMQVR